MIRSGKRCCFGVAGAKHLFAARDVVLVIQKVDFVFRHFCSHLICGVLIAVSICSRPGDFGNSPFRFSTAIYSAHQIIPPPRLPYRQRARRPHPSQRRPFPDPRIAWYISRLARLGLPCSMVPLLVLGSKPAHRPSAARPDQLGVSPGFGGVTLRRRPYRDALNRRAGGTAGSSRLGRRCSTPAAQMDLYRFYLFAISWRLWNMPDRIGWLRLLSSIAGKVAIPTGPSRRLVMALAA